MIIKTEEFNEDPQVALNRTFEFVGVSKFQVENLNKLNTGKYEEMNESTRKYLIEYFKPHNQRLSKLLGIELNWDKLEFKDRFTLLVLHN